MLWVILTAAGSCFSDSNKIAMGVKLNAIHVCGQRLNNSPVLYLPEVPILWICTGKHLNVSQVLMMASCELGSMDNEPALIC